MHEFVQYQRIPYFLQSMKCNFDLSGNSLTIRNFCKVTRYNRLNICNVNSRLFLLRVTNYPRHCILNRLVFFLPVPRLSFFGIQKRIFFFINPLSNDFRRDCSTKTLVYFKPFRFSETCCCLKGSQTTMSFNMMYSHLTLFETSVCFVLYK